MSTIEDIENAIANLPPAEFAEFRAWFDRFDAARFDAQIERDAKGGQLDDLADQALAAHRDGRTRTL